MNRQFRLGPMQAHSMENVYVFLLFLYITILIGADVYMDFSSGVSFIHILTEVSIFACSIAGLSVVMAKILWNLKVKLNEYERNLEHVVQEALQWQARANHLISGLSEAIDQQFDRWHLTVSEREVALLMLKGLSLKDVAKTRHVSERTVRQQTLAVYRKTGLAGRAELSAFFLEDLFLPIKDRQ